MIEQLFNYKLNIVNEEQEGQRLAIREYHNGSLDTSNDNSKY